MSRTWTTPRPAPAVRSAVPSRPVPSRAAIARPTAAPIDSPMRDRADEPDEDEERPDRRVELGQRVGEVGEREDGEHPTGDRAEQAA